MSFVRCAYLSPCLCIKGGTSSQVKPCNQFSLRSSHAKFAEPLVIELRVGGVHIW